MSMFNFFKRGQRATGPTITTRPRLSRREFISLYKSIITEAIAQARDQRAVSINFSKASKRAHEIYAIQSASGRPGSAVEAIQVAVSEMPGEPFRPRGSQPVPTAMALVPFTGSTRRDFVMTTARKPSSAVWKRYFGGKATASEKSAVKAYLATTRKKPSSKKAKSRKASSRKASSRKASSKSLNALKSKVAWDTPRKSWNAAQRAAFGRYMQAARGAKGGTSRKTSRKASSRKVGSRKASPKRSFSGGRKSNAPLGKLQKRATRKPSQVACATNAGKNAAVKAMRANKAELEALVGRSSLDSLYYIANALTVAKKATKPNQELLKKAIRSKKGSTTSLFGKSASKKTSTRKKSASKKASSRKASSSARKPSKAVWKRHFSGKATAADKKAIKAYQSRGKATTRKKASSKPKTRKAATSRKASSRAGSKFKVSGTVDVRPA